MAPLSRWFAIGSCVLTTCYGTLILPRGDTQKPLVHDTGIFSQQYTSQALPLKTQQNDTICDAGSSQWTGHVPLGKGRNMFYCMVSIAFITHNQG